MSAIFCQEIDHYFLLGRFNNKIGVSGMLFEYSEYYQRLFLEPIHELIFGLILLIYFGRELICEIRFKYSGTHSCFLTVFSLFVGICLLTVATINLRFGVYLIYEKESMVEEYVGEIESIEERKYVRLYSYEGNKVESQIVIIDGEKYLFTTTGDLEIGDFITVDYLPKSRVVLEWSVYYD